MTVSEDIADDWFAEKGIFFEKNGYPDRWRIDEKGRQHFVEYKLEGQDLGDNQLMMRDFLIKAGAHYQLVLVKRNGEVKIVFDSDLHKIA